MTSCIDSKNDFLLTRLILLGVRNHGSIGERGQVDKFGERGNIRRAWQSSVSVETSADALYKTKVDSLVAMSSPSPCLTIKIPFLSVGVKERVRSM